MNEKKYRNIVPITCYNVVVEPGQVWERVSDGYRHGRAICEVGARIIQDTRLFEPIEEEWPKYGDGYRCISSLGANLGPTWCDSTWDRERLAIGNVFHPETKLNPHGVNVDDARKLLLVGLKDEKFARGVLHCIRMGHKFTAPLETALALRRIDYPQAGDEEARES